LYQLWWLRGCKDEGYYDSERFAGEDMGEVHILNYADGNDDGYGICGCSDGYLTTSHQMALNKMCGFGW
jgi:hypothetical protein